MEILLKDHKILQIKEVFQKKEYPHTIRISKFLIFSQNDWINSIVKLN